MGAPRQVFLTPRRRTIQRPFGTVPRLERKPPNPPVQTEKGQQAATATGGKGKVCRDSPEQPAEVEPPQGHPTRFSAELSRFFAAERTKKYPLSEASKLSPRQRQVLFLLGAGDVDKDIADKLGIAPRTVRDYVRSARRLLDMPYSSRVHLARWCWENGELLQSPTSRRCGHPKVPTPCRRCKEMCASYTLAIEHCRRPGIKGPRRIPTPCPRCHEMCEGAKLARIHCRGRGRRRRVPRPAAEQ